MVTNFVWAFMWVLVSVDNPEQYFEKYRTPDNLERSVAYFRTMEQCTIAQQALYVSVMFNAGYWLTGYKCVYEKVLIPENEAP